MKILSQNEIDARKSEDKRFTLEEGLRIAKKIDEVRSTLFQEESNLKKFREETTKIVQAEIDKLIGQRDTLQYEVDVLNRQNLNLKKPFDEEWEMIKMMRVNELDEKLYNVESREKELNKKLLDFSYKEKSLQDAETRILDQDNRSTKALEEARLKEKEAQDLLNDAKLRDDAIQREINEKTKIFREKESGWLAKERDLDIREEALRRSVQELVKRERFINDKYMTLQRTMKALEDKKKNQ